MWASRPGWKTPLAGGADAASRAPPKNDSASWSSYLVSRVKYSALRRPRWPAPEPGAAYTWGTSRDQRAVILLASVEAAIFLPLEFCRRRPAYRCSEEGPRCPGSPSVPGQEVARTHGHDPRPSTTQAAYHAGASTRRSASATAIPSASSARPGLRPIRGQDRRVAHSLSIQRPARAGLHRAGRIKINSRNREPPQGIDFWICDLNANRDEPASRPLRKTNPNVQVRGTREVPAPC